MYALCSKPRSKVMLMLIGRTRPDEIREFTIEGDDEQDRERCGNPNCFWESVGFGVSARSGVLEIVVKWMIWRGILGNMTGDTGRVGLVLRLWQGVGDWAYEARLARRYRRGPGNPVSSKSRAHSRHGSHASKRATSMV